MANDGSEFLSVKELAGRLRLSRSTVYDLVERGIIPHYKVGKKIIFEWVKVEEWLQGYYRPGCTVRQPYNRPLPKIFKGVL